MPTKTESAGAEGSKDPDKDKGTRSLVRNVWTKGRITRTSAYEKELGRILRVNASPACLLPPPIDPNVNSDSKEYNKLLRSTVGSGVTCNQS